MQYEVMILLKRFKIPKTIFMVYRKSPVKMKSSIKQWKKVNEDTGAEVMTAQYNTLTDQAAALLDRSVEAIVYDEGYGGILDEVYEGFNNQIEDYWTI